MPAADTAEILALREPARSGDAVMLEGDAETVPTSFTTCLPIVALRERDGDERYPG